MSKLRNDLIAAAALLLGLGGAASAWLDQPNEIDVPPGQTDSGLYEVQAFALDERKEAIVLEDDQLEPVAHFAVRGRVLHLERFKPYQSLTNWIPGLRSATHDIGLGFGPMTDTANVQLFSFTHDGATNGYRALRMRPRGERQAASLPALAPHITNVHVVPANEDVFRAIKRIRIGELVTLRGDLVNVRDAQGRLAVTSTTSGDRDCEIMWVRSVEIGQL